MRRSANFKNGVFAALTAAVLALTGCTALHDDVVYNEKQREIRYSWWGDDDRSERTLKSLSGFKEIYGINVRPEYAEFSGFKLKMDSQLKSSTEADVMQVNYDWLYEYSPDGEGFYDLSLLSDYIDLSTYPEGSLECGTIGGKLIAVPYSLNALTFIYNKSLFDKYGLELPETWDDLFEAADLMSKDGITVLQLTEKNFWLLSCAYFEQTTGRRVYDEGPELDLTAADYEMLIGFAVRLLNEGVSKLGADYDRTEFSRQEMAGTVTWASDPGFFEKTSWENSFTAELGPYPTVENAKAFGWYTKPTGLYAIKKETRYPKESAQLLNYLINSEENAAIMEMSKGVPISRAATETLESRNLLGGAEHKAAMQINSTPQLGVMSPYMENSYYISTFTDLYESVYYGKATVTEAAEQAAKRMKSE